jgi:hypothetical protein
MAAPLGNQNAANAKEWRQALRRAMAHKADGDYRDTLLLIAAAVVDKALEGDKDAWREIADREDGKPAQTIAGDSDAPLVFEKIVRQIVRPDNPHG